MKKFIILSILAGLLPISMMAQDDLYFVPKKVDKTAQKQKVVETPVYYSGSRRDVDEYNRRGLRSYYQKIGTDSLGNDIIEFRTGDGYPSAEDTVYVGPTQYNYADEDADYEYTRRMSRWDGFYDPWFYGMGYGWHSPWWYHRYGWYDPWYYGSYWYDPWYYGWYSPWYYGGWGGYYGWYGGWYSPWYYGGWGGYWWPHSFGVAYNGPSGTQNHGRINYSGAPRGIRNGSSVAYSNGTFGSNRAGTFGARRNTVTTDGTRSSYNIGSQRSTSRSSNGNFGGNRTRTYNNSNSGSTRSYSSSSSSSSSGSFGGSGTFGGSRSSGGSFGGGGSRSGGGGGHFGGRR